MNIFEAAKTGRPFKRPNFINFLSCPWSTVIFCSEEADREFPRVFIGPSIFVDKYGQGMAFLKQPDDFSTGVIEYLSVKEHEAILLEERTKLKHEIIEIASRSYSGDWQRWFAVKEFLESI